MAARNCDLGSMPRSRCLDNTASVIQCHDHHMCVVNQMLGVHRINVLTRLVFDHLDEVFQLVDRIVHFAAIEISLRFVEFLEQPLRHALTIDVSHVARVYHTLTQRRNRRCVLRATHVLMRQHRADS